MQTGKEQDVDGDEFFDDAASMATATTAVSSSSGAGSGVGGEGDHKTFFSVETDKAGKGAAGEVVLFVNYAKKSDRVRGEESVGSKTKRFSWCILVCVFCRGGDKIASTVYYCR